METFSFEFFVPTHEYPENNQISFGGGYSFASKPDLPVQRTFKLKSEGLFWYRQGSNFSRLNLPTKNILCLNDFYEAHLMWKRFILPHEVFGNLVVRFSSPFSMPSTRPGIPSVKSGFEEYLTEPFELRMIEQPL